MYIRFLDTLCFLEGVVPVNPEEWLFKVNLREPVDVSKLRIFGPGVEGPVKSQEPTHFTIDAKQAGPGAVEASNFLLFFSFLF